MAYSGSIPDFRQDNLRGRVSYITLDESGTDTYDHATHFSYDVHGNVKTLVQELPSMEGLGVGRSFKIINYDYDLVS